jgi:type I restriction enzyme, S subunit
MTAGRPSPLVPNLRFPEFRSRRGWPFTTLGAVLEEHGLKSDGTSEVHSVSLAKGIVPQVEHMGRSFAASDTAHYSLVRLFDVVYTRSPLAIFKLGIVKQHKRVHNAIVSPLYGVFTPRNRHLGLIIEAYFDSPSRSIQLLDPLAQKGAKNTIQLSNDRFLSGALHLPEDEDEQQKIADCLGSLDDVIAAEGQKLEALRQHKQGLMRQLFPRPGETLPRLRFPEFRNAGEWKEEKLDDLAKLGTGHTPNKATAEYYNGGIKWVSLADSKRLDRGLITETAIEISEEGIKNSSAVLHPAGSVILSRDAGVGKSAIISGAMAVSQHFIVWTCDPAILSNSFLYYQLQLLKPLFERIATGNTIKTIGLPFFNALQITVPRITEQQQIAACLSSLDEMLAAQSRKVEGLTAHKQGLLQQLFPCLEEESR